MGTPERERESERVSRTQDVQAYYSGPTGVPHLFITKRTPLGAFRGLINDWLQWYCSLPPAALAQHQISSRNVSESYIKCVSI